MKRKHEPTEEELKAIEAKRLYDITYPILMAPWHGTLTPIRVRLLGDSTTLACGDFGLIKSFGENLSSEFGPTLEEMNAYAERHHEICKLTMVNPTFDEMFAIAGAHIDSKEIDKRLKDIEDVWKEMPPGPDRVKLKNEFDLLELSSKFILPPDFTAFIVNYALQIDKTDINDVTEDVLMNAAIMTNRCGGAPHTHFPGVLTPRMVKEFDNAALVLFDKKTKKKAS